MPSHTQEAAVTRAVPATVAAVVSPMRFSIREAAALLRMSRAQLYNRIHEGAIKPHKDGGRTYFTRSELERYVDSCR